MKKEKADLTLSKFEHSFEFKMNNKIQIVKVYIVFKKNRWFYINSY